MGMFGEVFDGVFGRPYDPFVSGLDVAEDPRASIWSLAPPNPAGAAEMRQAPGASVVGGSPDLSDQVSMELARRLIGTLLAAQTVRNAAVNLPQQLGFAPPARTLREGFENAPRNFWAGFGLLPGGPSAPRMPPPTATAPVTGLLQARQRLATNPFPNHVGTTRIDKDTDKPEMQHDYTGHYQPTDDLSSKDPQLLFGYRREPAERYLRQQGRLTDDMSLEEQHDMIEDYLREERRQWMEYYRNEEPKGWWPGIISAYNEDPYRFPSSARFGKYGVYDSDPDGVGFELSEEEYREWLRRKRSTPPEDPNPSRR